MTRVLALPRFARVHGQAGDRQGIVRFLDDIGLLSPRLTVAHGVHLTDEECGLMAERGVTVAINTACNLRLRSGVAPVGRFSGLARIP